jgi:RHS repeat-associated protein
VRQQFTLKERDIETGLDYFGARYYASVQGRFTRADPIPVTKESFLNPQRWNLYVYVNNNPLGAVDPNGADGQGKAGDKVISVFLDFSLKDLGRRVTTDPVTKKVTKDVPNTTDWQGTASGAPDGYRVEVFGNPDVTGEKGLPQRVTDAAFNNALKNSEVVIYVGHGRGDPGTVPFLQQGIQAGNTLYTPTGTTGAIETAVLPVGTQVSATGAKPETQASVVGNLSCNASRNGGAYFSFTGNNQVMVTMNSNWDGVTSFDALDKAANAFVKTYMNTGGNVQKAIDAANKVLQSIPGETKQNVGDRVEATKVN